MKCPKASLSFCHGTCVISVETFWVEIIVFVCCLNHMRFPAPVWRLQASSIYYSFDVVFIVCIAFFPKIARSIGVLTSRNYRKRCLCAFWGPARCRCNAPLPDVWGSLALKSLVLVLKLGCRRRVLLPGHVYVELRNKALKCCPQVSCAIWGLCRCIISFSGGTGLQKTLLHCSHCIALVFTANTHTLEILRTELNAACHTPT